MENTILVKDLALFVLFAVGVVALIYLIVVLKNVSNLVKKGQKLIADNEEAINQTLEQVPETVRNINETTILAKHSLAKADATITTVGDAVSETVLNAKDQATQILSYAEIGKEIILIIMDMFGKGKSKD